MARRERHVSSRKLCSSQRCRNFRCFTSNVAGTRLCLHAKKDRRRHQTSVMCNVLLHCDVVHIRYGTGGAMQGA